MKKVLIALMLCLLVTTTLFASASHTEQILPNNLITHKSVWSPTTEVNRNPIAVNIGDGIATSYRFPWSFYFQNSVAETIYLASELNIIGELQGLTFYNTFFSDIAPYPVRIWVGETDQDELIDYIPASELTQVFSGNVAFPAGENAINITFDTPYNYGGGNLVILTERDLESTFHAFHDRFFTTPTELTNRTLSWVSDSIDLDPNTVTEGSVAVNISNEMPNVTLYFVPQGMGTVSGSVTDATNGLAGVNLAIAGTNYQTTSTADGSFAFPFVPEGENYELTATLHGYYEATATFDVVENEETVVDIAMALLSEVEVTGQIITNDTGLGVQAHITLSGYENYEVDSDADGYFTITNVYTNQTYTGTATAGDYQPVVFTVEVAETNLDLGEVLITKVLFPAARVTATLDGDSAVITWEEPIGDSVGEWITKGAEENSAGVGTGSALVISASQMYTEAELINKQGMYINSIKFFPTEISATYTLKVWGGLDGNTELYSQPVASFTNEAWNEYVLDSSVAIPATGPLYIGYVADTPTGRPAGCDAGPAVPGGSMVKLGDQLNWDILSEIATINGNWNIQAYLTWARGDLQPIANFSTTRALEGYKVWRLLRSEQNSEANWTSLTDEMITDLAYTDNSWNTLSSGAYKYAVKVIYSSDLISLPAFSNELLNDMYGTVEGVVATSGTPADGAIVTLAGNSTTTDASGYFLFTDVLADEYVISASVAGFVTGTQSITVAGSQITTVNFDLEESNILFSDSFESYSDFALEADPWVLVDRDLSVTFGMTNITFPNSTSPMAYIVMNPLMTTPPLTEEYNAQDGTKYMVSFAAVNSPNNDWLMTPEFTVGGSASFSFWAKSVVDAYGLERFNVLISDGSTNPDDFVRISGPNYLQAPIDWTQYIYSLNDYANQSIRVAIQCVSNNAFMFMVDNVKIDAPGGTDNEENEVVAAISALVGNYPNPFNPETTISFSTKESGRVSLDIYNIKGQKVRTLLNDHKDAGNHTVVWNGKDDSGKSVASGVFFYRMKSGKFSFTKKMILMK